MVSDAVLLKYAKTKMIMKNTPNVKNAKKFSELTPTKQKIARSSYQKDIMKKSKNITRAPPSAKKKYGHTEGTFLLGAPPSKKRIETGKLNPGSVKTTKKGNARKGKPVGSRLAFDATKQEAKKTTKKKETRKKPPMLKGLGWKMTKSKVNEKENYWEWEAKGADWIEQPGETTTYVYTFDSLAGKDIMDADMVRKGMIEDEDGTSYSIEEFKKEYRKLLNKMK